MILRQISRRQKACKNLPVGDINKPCKGNIERIFKKKRKKKEIPLLFLIAKLTFSIADLHILQINSVNFAADDGPLSKREDVLPFTHNGFLLV